MLLGLHHRNGQRTGVGESFRLGGLHHTRRERPGRSQRAFIVVHLGDDGFPLVRVLGRGLLDDRRSRFGRLCLALEVLPEQPGDQIAAARVAGAQDDACIKLAAAVEFIHTATLLHDDVVDSSQLRRGKVAAHLIWGAPAKVVSV